jgi:hypothetical protein
MQMAPAQGEAGSCWANVLTKYFSFEVVVTFHIILF